MRVTKTLVIATHNRGKHTEFKALFQPYADLNIVMAGSILRNAERLGSSEIFDTYLENAMAKARLVSFATHYPALADDSGLEVLALDGKPGPRSDRFAPPLAGISQTQANMDHLLRQIPPGSPMDARFVCTLVLIIEGIALHATGTLEGTIITSPRGTAGFGYDPIFVPKGGTKTLAELSPGEKNAISHRARALRDLMEQINAHGIVMART